MVNFVIWDGVFCILGSLFIWYLGWCKWYNVVDMKQEKIQYEKVILVFWMVYIVDMKQERIQYEDIFLAVYLVFGILDGI